MSPRRGLVLGSGGVLGSSYTIGALAALREVRGWAAGEADVIVGTSAGSVIAAGLGCGVGVETLLNHQRGVVAEGDVALDYDYDTGTGGALPPRPRLRLGSPRLLARSIRHPWRRPPLAMLSGLAPQGRGTMGGVGAVVAGLVGPGEWAPHPATWIVAMDYDSGWRVPLGRAGEPAAGLVEAVMASCAIPGWYAPVAIDGRRYVDGGTWSPTSADLLAPVGLDEVVVIAPMASFALDAPTTMGARLERRLRRLMTKRMMREVDEVRRSGARVTVLAPGPEDLAAIGANLMDPDRREQVLETALRTATELLNGRAGAAEAAGAAGLAGSAGLAGPAVGVAGEAGRRDVG